MRASLQRTRKRARPSSSAVQHGSYPAAKDHRSDEVLEGDRLNRFMHGIEVSVSGGIGEEVLVCRERYLDGFFRDGIGTASGE